MPIKGLFPISVDFCVERDCVECVVIDMFKPFENENFEAMKVKCF